MSNKFYRFSLARALWLIGAFACASTSAVLTIDASAQKVPKTRNQLKIEYTASKISEAYLPPLSFKISGANISVIQEGQPGMLDLNSGPVFGYFIIELLREKRYKLSVTAESERGMVPCQGHELFARLQQGNALILTEDQFDRFAAEYRDARINDRASERARQVLAEAKAQGLKIAVENWPHEEAFPPLETTRV